MSNLKIKFLLGVMTVALMFVGVVALKAPTAAAASCTFTSTLKVGSKGASVSCLQTALGGITADGSYGPKTAAAVMAWQTTMGLTADGVFGPASQAKFGSSAMMTTSCPVGQFNPTTGQPCSAMSTLPAGCVAGALFSSTTGASCTSTMSTLPAGCTSTAGFSPTTGANCSTGATTTVNSTAAGTISSDGVIGGYLNTVVGNGDVNHQVAGLQLTGAGGGSNLNLNYATLQLTQTAATGSGRLVDYFSSVSIMENGQVVGTVPASAFTQTSSSNTLNNVYAASVPLTGATVTAGVTNNFYVAVTANSSIDSANFSHNNWEIAINNVRFTDGTGLTLTYTPSSFGTLSSAVQFQFGSAASANNIVLNVNRASSDQNSHTVTVNATGSTTQKVPLLQLSLSDQGGQTVSVNKLPVTFTTTATHVSDVTPEVYLMNGTTILDSENVNSTACTTTNTCPIYFKNFQTPVLVNGSAQTLTVAADINAVSSYTAGNTLQAQTAIWSGGWDLSVGNQNGAEIVLASNIVPGIAQGQSVAFYATGASVTESSDVCTANNGSQASSTSSLTCTIAFSVTANNTTVYMPTASTVANDAASTTLGTSFTVAKSTGNITGSSVASSVTQVGTNATLSGAEWIISPGVTANFTATVTFTDSGNIAPGLYRAYLYAVNYNTASGGTPWATSFGYNLGSVNTVVPGYTQVY